MTVRREIAAPRREPSQGTGSAVCSGACPAAPQTGTGASP